MKEPRSMSTRLHRQIRRELQSGRYPPGQRIDPGALAAEFKSSPTPVRFALHRLVGEGLIVDNEREGFHVPPVNEVELRDLYDWMEKLLLMACDIGVAQRAKEPRHFELTGPDTDIVKLTWKLFDAIALSAADHFLYCAVRRTNDRLAPIRRAKRQLIDEPVQELEHLQKCWRAGDADALKSALVDYHERRKQLVPYIVALLSGTIYARS